LKYIGVYAFINAFEKNLINEQYERVIAKIPRLSTPIYFSVKYLSILLAINEENTKKMNGPEKSKYNFRFKN
jgi:hypothetical protein